MRQNLAHNNTYQLNTYKYIVILMTLFLVTFGSTLYFHHILTMYIVH